ncbi:hypothetical protein [Burkholderia cenocepacia]|uniref:hypothetical protein n=1 Tax=Burkholderia cenocepacia TaxID=95486 RepID=UPI0013E06755|nr:hypothetical protein [Burkholderia cenocepacia]MCW3583976.1 hypothetical protein [Burkholderia cenocepacia]MCW3629585.1 hypothetical protein [Burkholderia cenocepacia]MCW5182613.1 hypothetical protein [Burkholderia cenocepacia]NGO98946.1 hypothetical protein [Burkholderia cenocepacia]
MHITSLMLRSGETMFEASDRIELIRKRRRNYHAPVDKLAERERLTKYWRACMPEWQPELCRINPAFAFVHVQSFRPGMNFGHLSLLPGHVPPYIAYRERLRTILPRRAAAPAQLALFEATT